VTCYNEAIGSLESRVLVSARRFKEKGIAASEEIAALEPLDRAVRLPQSVLTEADVEDSS